MALISKGIYRVLIIEENPKQTEIYSQLIREVAQCKVDVVSRVESSVDWIAQSNYHLVLLGSPSVDRDASGLESSSVGLSILEHIKRVSPATSVILIPENAAVEEAVAAIRLGAEDYLQKPFKLESLQLAIKRGLDRKAVFGDDVGASLFLNLLYSCQMISASLEQKKIFEIIRSYLKRELKSGYSSIYTIHNDNVVLADDGAQGSDQDRAMQEILDIALHASSPLARMVEIKEYFRFIDRGQLTPGLFIFRFQCAGPSDYFCVCLSPERPAIPEAFEGRIRMLRAQIEVTGKNIERYMGVQKLAYVDDATGLYNTRYLNYVLDREIAQSKSTGSSFAVLFIDCDYFKKVNDTHGHLIGTRLLHELGDQLKKFVREKDTVFRYGGDEFVAVLSSCDLQTAKTVAERIRHAVANREFLKKEGVGLRFTVSIGIALFPDHARSKKDIIHSADQAMYSAKKNSRNRVTIAAPAGKVKEGAAG